MQKIFLIFLLGTFATRCAISIQHDVVPACGPEEEVCQFEFHVDYTETMVYFANEGRNVPVVYRNGSFFRRTGCDEFEPMTSEDWESVSSADGRYRMAIAINGQIPGPNVVVYEGQQVVVKLTNHLLEEGITIHWHGMLQWRTPWMDGVGTVSQCPINPGETFTYRFLADPPGTHWYHSHLGVQRTDGLAGALIVLPKEPDVPRNIEFIGEQQEETSDDPVGDPHYDHDYIIYLQDWYEASSLEVNKEADWGLLTYHYGMNESKCFTSTRTSDGGAAALAPFESGTINGKGYHFVESDDPDLPELPIEWFNVKKYSHSRFRIINGGMMFAFRISVDGHQIQIIGTDGNDVEAFGTESVVVHAGERVDIQLYAGAKEGNYWIRAETLEDTERPGKTLAALHYEEDPDMSLPKTEREECTQLDKCRVVNCAFGEYKESYNIECVPVSNLTSTPRQISLHPVPKFTTEENFQEIFLNFHFSSSAEIPFTASVNGHKFLPASEPPQIFPATFNDSLVDCGTKDCSDTCECTYVVPLELGKTIQVVLVNDDESAGFTAHPVHMHGHHFHVLKIQYPEYNSSTGTIVGDTPDITCDNPSCNTVEWTQKSWKNGNVPGLNLENPPMKDTLIVPRKGYAVLRITGDNPGYWFMHCHIEMHQIGGMALILKEGETEDMTPTPDEFPTCGNFIFPEQEYKDIISGKKKREKQTSDHTPEVDRPFHRGHAHKHYGERTDQHGWHRHEWERKSWHSEHHSHIRYIVAICLLVLTNIVSLIAVCYLRNMLRRRNRVTMDNKQKLLTINQKLLFDSETKHKGSSKSKENLLSSIT